MSFRKELFGWAKKRGRQEDKRLSGEGCVLFFQCLKGRQQRRVENRKRSVCSM